MNQRMPWLPAALLCGLSASAVVAAGQDESSAEVKAETNPLLFVFVEHVPPSMTAAYEDATRQMVRELASYKVDPEKVSFRCVAGPELGYAYVIPLEKGFASMDTVRSNWLEAIDRMGEERWKEVTSKTDAAVTRREAFHVRARADLSYAPEKPAVKPEEVVYVNYNFYYAIPGHEEALEEIAKRFAALYREHGITTGWSVYQGVTGTDLPVYVVAYPARSERELAAARERVHETLGKAGDALSEEAMAHVRKLERREGWLRPDLSYPSDERD